jgi:hypothetical protein
MMNEIEIIYNVDQSNLPQQTVPVRQTNNEYISLYQGVIVYRDVSNSHVYKIIDKLLLQCRTARLLLVRQYGWDLQLLWTGSIPMEYIIRTRRGSPEITVDKQTYKLIASITISEDY